MLLTRCPNCLARFRVPPDVLGLRQGLVRCGQCQYVFNAFDAIDSGASETTDTTAGNTRNGGNAQTPTPPSQPASPASLASAAADAAPEAIIPPSLLASEPELEVAAESTPLTDQLSLNEPEALPPPPAALAPDAADEAPAIRDNAGAMTGPSTIGALRTQSATPAPFDMLRARARIQPPKSPRTLPWVVGCGLMVLLMGVQVAFLNRAAIAQSYPETRPWLESACRYLDCRVPWPANVSQIDLEVHQFRQVANRNNQFLLQATLANRANAAQPHPWIEVTLTDNLGSVVTRRALAPADYIGRAIAATELFTAGEELPIELTLESAKPNATGYEVKPFQP